MFLPNSGFSMRLKFKINYLNFWRSMTRWFCRRGTHLLYMWCGGFVSNYISQILWISVHQQWFLQLFNSLFQCLLRIPIRCIFSDFHHHQLSSNFIQRRKLAPPQHRFCSQVTPKLSLFLVSELYWSILIKGITQWYGTGWSAALWCIDKNIF